MPWVVQLDVAAVAAAATAADAAAAAATAARVNLCRCDRPVKRLDRPQLVNNLAIISLWLYSL